MNRKQGPKETAGGRVRVSVYLPKEKAAELNEILESLPIRVSMSGLIESVLIDAIPRIREEGIKILPRK